MFIVWTALNIFRDRLWSGNRIIREEGDNRKFWNSIVEKDLSFIKVSRDIVAQLTKDRQAWRNCIAQCAPHMMG